MRPVVRDFVRVACSAAALPGPVYEFGSYLVAGQEETADLRREFPGYTYVGCDMRPGPGVDLAVDVCDTGLVAGTVGTALLLDTLEHVEHPRRAMREVRRITAEDGIVLTSSVMQFPIHDYPADYWRFTPAGFASLMSEFPRVWTAGIGDELFPVTVLGAAAGHESTQWDGLVTTLDTWARSEQAMHEALKAAGWQFEPPPAP